MEYLFLGTTYFIGECCCWYVIFRCLGCIDPPEQRYQTHQEPTAQPQPPPPERNPFKNPSAPKDAHLQNAYS